ncbi:MAG: hypothetical protein FWC68_06600, partial [Oscillospiraceae bacterium]|nr:hypothetical protein [Oscillospiraceae bacterium]
MNKTKKIIGISVIVLVAIVLIVGSLWHFTNIFDRFRSDESLFFSYLGQNFRGLPRIDFDEAERFSNESYTSTITLAWELGGRELRNMLGSELDIINDLVVVMTQRVDSDKQRMAMELGVQHGNDEVISLEAIMDSDEISLGLSPILDQFLTIENRNLRELVESLGFDATLVPDSLDLDVLWNMPTLSATEMQEITRRYVGIVRDAIESDNTTSSREDITVNGRSMSANAYTLTLNEADVLNIVVALLEELKDDDVLLDYIVEIAPFIHLDEMFGVTIRRGHLEAELENMIENLQEFIEDLDGEDETNVIEITVYEYRGNTVLTRIEIADTAALVIEREVSGDETNLNFILYDYNGRSGELEEVGRFDVTVTSDRGKYTVSFEIEGVEVAITINSELTYFALNVLFGDSDISIEFNIEMTVEFGDTRVDRPRNRLVLNTVTEEEILGLLEDFIDGLERLPSNHRGALRDFLEEMVDAIMWELELLMDLPAGSTETNGQFEDVIIAVMEHDEMGIVFTETLEIRLNNDRIGEIIA